MTAEEIIPAVKVTEPQLEILKLSSTEFLEKGLTDITIW
jgi:hypothetical protein